MTTAVRCPSCNQRRKPFGRTLLGAVLCRFCTEKRISKRLGRIVLLTPQGKDSRTGQTFEELLAEMERVGRDRW